MRTPTACSAARKQKNESDMVEKIPVNQQNQSQQVEESSVTESTLSNSDESSDTNGKGRCDASCKSV